MKDYERFPEYEIIGAHYGGRRAKRSGRSFIDHIDQGVVVLDHFLEAEHDRDNAIKAYMLHPLLQDDNELRLNYPTLARRTTPIALVFAMEYRGVANRHLSDAVDQQIKTSPIPEVNAMLVADKIQNYKDFLLYQDHDDPEWSGHMESYFEAWLTALGVRRRYKELTALICTDDEKASLRL